MIAMNIDSHNLARTCFDLSKQVTNCLFKSAPHDGQLVMPLQIVLYPYFYEFLQQDNSQTYEMNCQIISDSLTNNLCVDLTALLRSSIDTCFTPEFYQQKAHEWGKYKYFELTHDDGIRSSKGMFTPEKIQEGFYDCFERTWGNSSKPIWEAFGKYNTDMVNMLRDHLPAIFEHTATYIVHQAIEHAQNYRNAIEFHEQQLWNPKTSEDILVAPLSPNSVRHHRDTPKQTEGPTCTLK